MHKPTRKAILGVALVSAVAIPVSVVSGAASAAPGGPVSVTVNGSPVALNPAPVTKAGRVFVPLRGIFEALGATVVYQSGTINATGQGNRTVSLTIGSTNAIVNGASQPLDVAPFVIGASTYVPLRFVGQALGATVNYDGANQIVAIVNGGAPNNAPNNNYAPPQAPATPAGSTLQLTGEQPPRGGTVAATNPTISTNFSQRVDPNSVHVTVDGRDVTGSATLSDSGMIFSPSSPLQSQRHEVVVTGKDASGLPFTKRWAFTSGTAQAQNFIRLRNLADGGAISGSSFVVEGTTLPNALVHVVAGSSRSLGNIFNLQTGNYSGDTTADGNGNFRLEVGLQTSSGGTVAVDITSTDPATKASAEQKLRLTSQ